MKNVKYYKEKHKDTLINAVTKDLFMMEDLKNVKEKEWKENPVTKDLFMIKELKNVKEKDRKENVQASVMTMIDHAVQLENVSTKITALVMHGIKEIVM